MAKVGDEKYAFGGVHSGNGYLEYKVYYTKKDGFYAVAPELIKQYVDTPTVYGKTYDAVVLSMKSLIVSFYNKGMKQEKVILYHFTYAVGSGNSIQSNESFYESGSYGKSCRQMLKVDYRVVWMTTIGNKPYISERKINSVDDLNNRDISKWHWSDHGGYSEDQWMRWEYIPHTEKSENWFKSMTENLSKLIMACVEFFGEDEKHLLKSIVKSDKNLLDYEK